MSTNKTTNYKLHSWEKDDKFLMDEMNENFSKLDKALDQELQKRDATLKKKGQLVTGTYVGTGSGSQTFDLGAPVLSVHLESYKGTRPEDGSSLAHGGLILPGHALRDGAAKISGNTFVVNSGGMGTWRTNTADVVYYYLAWIEA